MRSSGPSLVLAFALAAVVSGLAFSCSSTDAPPAVACDSTNCGGCCEDADGGAVCVPLAKQEFDTCGHAGNACRACVPGQVCSSGSCLAGTVDSGVDAGTPDAGPKDAGVDAGPDPSCGHANEACCHGGACYIGLTCDGTNVCRSGSAADAGVDAGTDAGTTNLVTGSACGSDGQCKSGHCEQSFPGGYCTPATCATDADCAASGGVCGYNQEGTSLVCLATCAAPGTQSSCRSGYVCDSASSQDGVGVCVPACSTGTCASCSPDGFCCGGTNALTGKNEACCSGAACNGALACDANGYCAPDDGPKATGSACTDGTGCAGDVCISQASGSGCNPVQDVCWSNGYCSQTCQSDGTGCASGSSCSNFGTAGYLCLDDCTWDGASGGCRSGYVCDRFVAIGPGSSTTASCVNACTSDADSATGSCWNGFSCGQELYRCCGTTCAEDLICQTTGPYAGYCTH